MSRSLLIMAIGLCLGPTDARAQLSLCNHTEVELDIALAAPSDTTDVSGWTSRGWFVLGPDACGDLIAELRYRYYYLYVEETLFRASVSFGDVKVWGHRSDRPVISGDYEFCVSPSDEFEIADRPPCEVHGYRSAGFREIDVGEQASFVITIGSEQ